MFIKICKEIIIRSLLLLVVIYAHKSATSWRGYEAVGGEFLILSLRGLYLIGKKTYHEWKEGER